MVQWRAILLLLVLVLSGCSLTQPSMPAPASPPASPSPSVAPPMEVTPSPVVPSPTPAASPTVTTITSGVSMPSALAFTPDGRLFFNEVYDGRIRVIQNGKLLDQPFAEIDVAHPFGYTEHGLLGLAIDPDFATNHYVYAFYTVPDSNGQPVSQQIVRFTERDNTGMDMTVIVDDLPAGSNCCHNGGRIIFGPDGKLYASIGDTEDSSLSQQVDARAGRIFRFNPDGTVPPDNPFPDNPTYAFGLRNPYGIRFHPVTGKLFATENGPSGNDELNIIEPGKNYGWPVVRGIAGDSQFVDPIWVSDGSRAPTGLTIPSSDALSNLKGDVVFCDWNTSTLHHFVLSKPGYDRIESEESLPESCGLDVVQGSDGGLYFSDEDAIYRYGPS